MLKYRPVGKNDDLLVEKWVAADKWHSDPTFWLPPKDAEKQHKGVKYGVVEDAVGTIGYVVLENVLRIHVQFPPSTETDRIRAAIDEFIPRLIENSKSQYKQIVFESESPALIFYLRKFGFRRSKNEIVCSTGAK